MSGYGSDTRVRVSAFERRLEGDAVMIGDVARQVYLTIPAQALVILDSLSEGRTVGEARDRYAAMYGETPDMEDFLEALELEGLVAAVAAGDAVAPAAQTPAVAEGRDTSWLSQERCRRLCGAWVGGLFAVVIVTALAMIASDPRVVPGPSALVFTRDFVPLVLGLTVFEFATTALHELAHLIAARAAGAPARIRVGHRLWFVVAETDMTGIWLASKRDRYRAFLAGSLVDATSASLFVGLLWAHQRAGLGFSPLELEVLSACLLIYLLRILWQCFFFVRTDFYFVVTTAFNCKSLLDDTTNYLRNRSSALLRLSRPVVDQSHIPSGEMRVIRWYSLVWLAGRVIAFASLLFITFPILWRYVRGIAPMLVGDRSTYGVLDAVIFGVLGIGLAGTGMTMWVRSIFQKVRERKSDAVARAALQHR